MRSEVVRPGWQYSVKQGLLANEKSLPHWLLLDLGDADLFSEMIRIPEHYPAVALAELDKTYGAAIAYNLRQESVRWNFIDCIDDANSPHETIPAALADLKAEVVYYPVGLSDTAVANAAQQVAESIPSIGTAGSYAEISETLAFLPTRKIPSVYFLGQSAGSLEYNDLVVLLRALSTRMQRRDRIIMTVDLKKSPSVIERSVHDYQGVNTAFHKSVLSGINRLMKADFDLRQFEYWPIYDAVNGGLRKYLVSLSDQVVHFPEDDFEVLFRPWETIFVGLSQKYSEEMINDLIHYSGLKGEKILYDSRKQMALLMLSPLG